MPAAASVSGGTQGADKPSPLVCLLLLSGRTAGTSDAGNSLSTVPLWPCGILGLVVQLRALPAPAGIEGTTIPGMHRGGEGNPCKEGEGAALGSGASRFPSAEISPSNRQPRFPKAALWPRPRSPGWRKNLSPAAPQWRSPSLGAGGGEGRAGRGFRSSVRDPGRCWRRPLRAEVRGGKSWDALRPRWIGCGRKECRTPTGRQCARVGLSLGAGIPRTCGGWRPGCVCPHCGVRWGGGRLCPPTPRRTGG